MKAFDQFFCHSKYQVIIIKRQVNFYKSNLEKNQCLLDRCFSIFYCGTRNLHAFKLFVKILLVKIFDILGWDILEFLNTFFIFLFNTIIFFDLYWGLLPGVYRPSLRDLCDDRGQCSQCRSKKTVTDVFIVGIC